MSKTHVYSQQPISMIQWNIVMPNTFLQNSFTIVNFLWLYQTILVVFFQIHFHFNCIYIKKDNNGVNNPIVSGLYRSTIFMMVCQCEEEALCFHYRISFFYICFNTHENIPSHFQCIYFFKSILIYYSRFYYI